MVHEKTYKLTDFKAENEEFPGKYESSMTLEFDENVENDLKSGYFITPDWRNGQILEIQNVENNKVVVKLYTPGKEDWFHGKHMQKNTLFQRVEFNQISK